MTAVVFTGSRDVPQVAEAWVRQCIQHYRAPQGERGLYITGGQRGLDLLAAEACLWQHPAADHRLWLPAKAYPAAQVQALVQQHRPQVARHGGTLEVYRCLGGTDYRYRNLAMLQHLWYHHERGRTCYVLAFPRWPEDDPRSSRSGTWLCVRQARTAGLPVVVYPLWQGPQ